MSIAFQAINPSIISFEMLFFCPSGATVATKFLTVS